MSSEPGAKSVRVIQHVKCPYCGARQLVVTVFSTTRTARQVVTCDVETGGCDCDFVVEVRLCPETTLRRIEGEGV